MLDRSATYHKSQKGAEAIANRHGPLAPRLRSMLILINGKRGYDELARLGNVLGDPDQLMSQLEAEGYIEAGPPREGPPSQPAPLFETTSGWGALSAPAPLTPLELDVPLAQAQRFAVERLQDLLGPVADDLCARVQAAGSPQEFRAAVRRVESVLRSLVGPELATQFSSEVENQRMR